MHRHVGHHHQCAGAARGAFALPGTERRYERSLPFRFTHLEIDLRVHLDQKRVRGHVTHSLERVATSVRELTLDAVDFAIQKVEVDSGKGFAKADFDYDDRVLRVSMSTRFQKGRVRVHYEAEPTRGLYFLAPDDKVPDRPQQVWSQCQDEDARHWFPCHDKPHVKVPAQFRYTVPKGMQVLANGDPIASRAKATTGKQQKKSKDAWVSYRFRIDQPLPSYLVTLVVGQFDVVKDRDAVLPSGRTVPVEYWVPKGKKQDGLRGFAGTPRKIEKFSELLGVEYPFSRYTQIVVNDFVFGGMENTTATTMYEHVLIDERASIDIDSHDLVAHELAHQWFGDWLTCRDWPQAWLNEGFATFFEHIDREDRKGEDEYLHGIERDVSSYLNEANSRYQRAIVCREYDEPIDLFDRHLYEKGALVLHLLRRELGEETFWAALSDYVVAHGQSNVETNDLKRAMELKSGRSLDRFFEQWLHRAGHPKVHVRVTAENKRLTVHFEQKQKDLPYELTYEVEVRIKGTTERHLLCSAERHAALSLPMPTRPEYVAIDPELRIVGDLQVEAPKEMLRNQLTMGQTPRVRGTAAKLLEKHHDWKSQEALSKALAHTKGSWMERVACARTLSKLRGERAKAALLAVRKDKSPEVRAQVATSLGSFREPDVEQALLDACKDESYLVTAAATLALGKTRLSAAGKVLEKQAKQSSWADVVASAAMDGLAELRDSKYASLIKRYTDYGVPTRARRSAVGALSRVSRSEETRLHLVELLDDPHPHFRLSVVAALEELAGRKVRNALSARLSRETDGRVVRRIKEALRRLDGGSSNRETLDRLAELERELNSLKGRLAHVEAERQKRK